MPGTYNVTTANAILIGLPWSLAVKVPQDMAGFGARFRILDSAYTVLAEFTDAPEITIGLVDDDGATEILIELSAADTAALSAQSAKFTLEVATDLSDNDAGERWLEGVMVIRP